MEHALKERELEVVFLQQQIEERRLKDIEREALKSARRKEKEEASLAKKQKKAKSIKNLWKSKPNKRYILSSRYNHTRIFGYLCMYILYI